MQSKFPSFANIANVKDSSLREPPSRQSFPQEDWRLKHILERELPRAPMDTDCPSASCIPENLHGIEGVGMYG